MKIALSERPEVVLVDIALPDVDGYEVGRRIREALGPAPTLAALTGLGQPEDRRRSEEVGFEAHLVKPVGIEDVIRLVNLRGSGRG